MLPGMALLLRIANARCLPPSVLFGAQGQWNPPSCMALRPFQDSKKCGQWRKDKKFNFESKLGLVELKMGSYASNFVLLVN